MNIEELSSKYFNDISVNNFKDFKTKTPDGNIIEGIICKKANVFLGSMVITKITLKSGESFETEQFIHAMPKIHYYDDKHDMFIDGQTIYPVYEKLDGTCLILFGLYKDGEVLEVVPKTRGVPVADPNIIDMYKEIDDSNIQEFFKQFKDFNPTLIFELYGAMNQHHIFYPNTRIDISLIGGSMEGTLVDWYDMNIFSKQFDFKRPKHLFNLVYYNGTWKIRYLKSLFYHYLSLDCEKIDEFLKKEYDTQQEVISELENVITRVNRKFSEKHNREYIEGVVIDSYNKSGNHLMYLKVKSLKLKERLQKDNGVPRKFIKKEIQKYFDEYGSKVKDIYKKDENHFVEYVNRNLQEEFDVTLIERKRTQSRIKDVFLDILEEKEPSKELKDICTDIVKENPDKNASELMRVFAEKYPEKKRHSQKVFCIFNEMV